MALIKKYTNSFFLNAIAITATGAAATVTDAGYCWSAFETDEILYHVDTKRYPFDSCESNCPCRFRLCLKLMNHFFYPLVSILFITRKISGSQNNLDYVANRQKIEREKERRRKRRCKMKHTKEVIKDMEWTRKKARNKIDKILLPNSFRLFTICCRQQSIICISFSSVVFFLTSLTLARSIIPLWMAFWKTWEEHVFSFNRCKIQHNHSLISF